MGRCFVLNHSKFAIMKLPSTLFFLLFTVYVFGQTSLKGTLTDENTGEPVILATVALYQNGILKTGTETDFDGNYSITELAPGLYDVEFTSTGYSVSKVTKLAIVEDKRAVLDMKLRLGKAGATQCFVTIPIIDQSEMTHGMRFTSHQIRSVPFRW